MIQKNKNYRHWEDYIEDIANAVESIEINLDAYREANQKVPERKSVLTHLENLDFKDSLFTYVDVSEPRGKKAA